MSDRSTRAVALRSGSSGNLYFIERGGTRLVLDCGINGRSFRSAMTEAGVAEDEINALSGILITHEHSDHISGLGVVLRRHHLPLYITEKTLKAALPKIGAFDPDLIHLIRPGDVFEIGNFQIEAVPTSHDAVEPLAFTFYDGHRKIAFCTDLGIFTQTVETALSGSQLVFLEANYEPRLLEYGPYPYVLKERIRGERGHLSNQASGESALKLLRMGMRHVVLSHLSKENNFPALAEQSVTSVLLEGGAASGKDYQLDIAKRYHATEPICFDDVPAFSETIHL